MRDDQAHRLRRGRDPPGRRPAPPRRTPPTRHGASLGCRAPVQVCHFGQALFLEGLTPSIGTVGDALDNALAETTIGLYKTECVRDGSPFRRGLLATLADLEEVTSTWVHWYNHQRLVHRLGRVPPAEAEAAYYATTDTASPAGRKN
jgi:hypothetical protein